MDRYNSTPGMSGTNLFHRCWLCGQRISGKVLPGIILLIIFPATAQAWWDTHYLFRRNLTVTTGVNSLDKTMQN